MYLFSLPALAFLGVKLITTLKHVKCIAKVNLINNNFILC